jgi:hypothetical protein
MIDLLTKPLLLPSGFVCSALTATETQLWVYSNDSFCLLIYDLSSQKCVCAYPFVTKDRIYSMTYLNKLVYMANFDSHAIKIFNPKSFKVNTEFDVQLFFKRLL